MVDTLGSKENTEYERLVVTKDKNAELVENGVSGRW